MKVKKYLLLLFDFLSLSLSFFFFRFLSFFICLLIYKAIFRQFASFLRYFLVFKESNLPYLKKTLSSNNNFTKKPVVEESPTRRVHYKTLLDFLASFPW